MLFIISEDTSQRLILLKSLSQFIRFHPAQRDRYIKHILLSDGQRQQILPHNTAEDNYDDYSPDYRCHVRDSDQRHFGESTDAPPPC